VDQAVLLGNYNNFHLQPLHFQVETLWLEHHILHCFDAFLFQLFR